MSSRYIRYRGQLYRRADTWPPTEEELSSNLPRPGQELTKSQQVALLQQDVQAWNKWYDKADDPANLIGVNLNGLRGAKVNLQGANLARANLSEADLQGADLRGAWLFEADLRWADLSGADLSGANLDGADLGGIGYQKLQQTNLQDARYSKHTNLGWINPQKFGMRLVEGH